MISQRVREQLTARAALRAREVHGVLESWYMSQAEYYIGGSSLAGNDYSDIDVFPTSNDDLAAWENIDMYSYRTPNATTLKSGPRTVQLCHYHQQDLDHLVDSFDFAHIQIGAYIKDDKVVNLNIHDNFVASRLTGTTWYTGSKYPLSSLTRLAKYARRNDPPVLARESALSIAIDLAYTWRGIDEDEFQEQLDGIDLPQDSNHSDLVRLGHMLWLEIKRGRKL